MAMSSADQMNIVWVDLEMTGLDIGTDQIIEMACIVTDKNLNVIETSPDIVIHQSRHVMSNMNEWCRRHHWKSGLASAVLRSKTSVKECENIMLNFIRKHTVKGKCCLAGNSVHRDKQFLEKFMPAFMSHLHYRIIDVSSVQEIARRWYPEKYEAIPVCKKPSHRALDDIKESIEKLKWYRKLIFIPVVASKRERNDFFI